MGCEAILSDQDGLFSLDMSQHGGSVLSKASDACVKAAELQGQRLADFAQSITAFERSLLHTVRRLKHRCTDSRGLDYSLLAKFLSEAGFLVESRAPQLACACKAKSQKCLEKLTHSYLVCTGYKAQPHQKEVIVEPKLREQFEIAHPTAPYTKLLEGVPAEFVGTPTRLRTIVEAISLAMAEAFKAQERSLPPWRRTAAALSKWDLEDPRTSNQTQQHAFLHGAITYKQPLKEQLCNDFNLPEVAGIDIFAKASITKSQRLVSVSPRQGHMSAAPGLENAVEKPKISLLARNLAEMALGQKARRTLETTCSAKSKLKRAPSWDFSGLPPITTVRRSGRVL